MNRFLYKIKSGGILLFLCALCIQAYGQQLQPHVVEREIHLDKTIPVKEDVKEIRASESITLTRGFRSQVEKGKIFRIGLSGEKASEDDKNSIEAVSNPDHTNRFTIYPNPVKGNAAISLELTRDKNVTIEMYNTQGQLIKVIAGSKHFSRGNHRVPVSVEGIPAGIYLVRLVTKDDIHTQKIIIQ